MTEPKPLVTKEQPGAPVDPDALDASAARRGDRDAFDRLVRRHQQGVVNAASYWIGGHREDALEIAQEAFLRAYRGIGRFRAEASFRTWLLRVTMNTARSWQARQRAKKRAVRPLSLSGAQPEREGEAGLDIPDTSQDPQERLLRREARRALRSALQKAIAELEPEAREIIVLRDLSGHSYQDIAGALDLPLGTVKSKVHRARLKLRAALEEHR